MNKERDKFLTEAMGECWHEGCAYMGYTGPIDCVVCGKEWYPDTNNDFSTWEGFGKEWYPDTNNDFSTWEGFGKLLKWSIEYGEQHNDKYLAQPTMALWYLTPDRFANAVYKHLKKNKQ